MFNVVTFFYYIIMVSFIYSRKNCYSYFCVSLLVVGVEHFAVARELPFTPPIIAFKRELYSFIFYEYIRCGVIHACYRILPNTPPQNEVMVLEMSRRW